MVVSMQTAAAPNIDFDRVFGALSDGTRRDIVRRAIHGDEGVATLAMACPGSFAAGQKHVAALERPGLVVKHQNARRKVLRTELQALRVAQALLKRYEELWQGRFERMTQLLNDTKENDK